MRRTATWVLLLVGFPWSISAIPPTPAASTPFELVEQGGIVVAARLNGLGPFRLLLDTGSTHSAISEDVARTIGAPPVAKALVGSAIGARMQAVVRVNRLEIGPVTAVGVLPSLIPRDRIDRTGSIQGVIGQDILAPLHYTIDFRKRCLIWQPDSTGPPQGSMLTLSPEGGSSTPLGTGPSTSLGTGPSTSLGTGPSTSLGTGPSTSLGTGPSASLGTGRFVVALPQNDRVLRLVPDSGASVLLLFNRGDRPFPSMTPAPDRDELTTPSARRNVRQVTVRELRVGSTTLRDVRAVLVEPDGTEPEETDGLLPLHLFDRVTFDGPRGLLFVQ